MIAVIYSRRKPPIDETVSQSPSNATAPVQRPRIVVDPGTIPGDKKDRVVPMHLQNSLFSNMPPIKSIDPLSGVYDQPRPVTSTSVMPDTSVRPSRPRASRSTSTRATTSPTTTYNDLPDDITSMIIQGAYKDDAKKREELFENATVNTSEFWALKKLLRDTYLKREDRIITKDQWKTIRKTLVKDLKDNQTEWESMARLNELNHVFDPPETERNAFVGTLETVPTITPISPSTRRDMRRRALRTVLDKELEHSIALADLGSRIHKAKMEHRRVDEQNACIIS